MSKANVMMAARGDCQEGKHRKKKIHKINERAQTVAWFMW